ncbi:hypothetical protein GCM10029992_49190 [Glycomyces albus]
MPPPVSDSASQRLPDKEGITMNRKLIAGIAAGMVLAATAACGDGGDSGGDEGPMPDAADVEGGYVPIISVELANPYWDTEAETARTELEALGYQTDVFQHENDPQRQNELIDAAISQDAVAIVLDPAGADESIGAVQRATEADIPVFLINAEINEEGTAISQIVANNAQGPPRGPVLRRADGWRGHVRRALRQPHRQQRAGAVDRLRGDPRPVHRYGAPAAGDRQLEP